MYICRTSCWWQLYWMWCKRRTSLQKDIFETLSESVPSPFEKVFTKRFKARDIQIERLQHLKGPHLPTFSCGIDDLCKTFSCRHPPSVGTKGAAEPTAVADKGGDSVTGTSRWTRTSSLSIGWGRLLLPTSSSFSAFFLSFLSFFPPFLDSSDEDLSGLSSRGWHFKCEMVKK